MADLYDKSISRWEGEGGYTEPTEDDLLPESHCGGACCWGDRGFWLKTLAVTGVAALAIYAILSRSSSSR
ncbi:MAG: hypothetical protein IT169_17930 [Bryobacterales bacterium]|nr:hypothetical protein [Bryobacterales bacterium]